MIIIEEAKRFFCNGCGSMLGVTVSDIKEVKASSDDKKGKKCFTCPVCQHNNFLTEEDMPTIGSRLMSDVKAFTDQC